MYRLEIPKSLNKYDFEELVKVFLAPGEYETVLTDEVPEGFEKNEFKRRIYRELSELTGKRPDWGILTGVRPVKLAKTLTKEELVRDYYLSEEKAALVCDTYAYQQATLGKPPKDSVGVYAGIPFCPTRCVYCSFASNQVGPAEISRYLVALNEEIDYAGKKLKEKGLFAESIYIGGGTPTTLTEHELRDFLSRMTAAFKTDRCREFTVEAGRPDTITEGKLKAILEAGAERISINPQSMKQRTLDLIGRSHTPEDIEKAFKLAHAAGIPVINADLIAGLPEEEPKDFEESLTKVMELGANNITVHTLAVKRASRLNEQDPGYHYRQADTVREMLAFADKTLRAEGYKPYYLYRQKHMAGAFENVGWCKPGTEGLYNVRIMEEEQTIVALGAGGVSKRYYSEENRLERVANVTNYEIYIDRLDEMLERKEKDLF